MFRLSLKNIWAHKSRLILSMLSVILGVAFLSGTLVFSATIERSFDDLFSSVFKQTDAYVRSTDKELSSDGFSEIPKNIPRTLLNEIKNVEGIGVVEGSITIDNLIVIGEDGKREFTSNGPPTLGFNLPKEAQLNPWVLADKNDEATSSKTTVESVLADNEIYIDRSTADIKDYKIGDKLKIVLSDSVREYTIKGFVRFGTADGIGGPPVFLFNDKQATDIANKGDTYSDIIAGAQEGVSQKELKNNIKEYFESQDYSNYEVLTGEEITEETQSDFREAIGFFTIGLLGFAIISFIVALIIIVNSFAIIMAQRKQEYALLRAVGAKPGQVRRSVLIEAVIVGIISSALGILTGIGLAVGIRKLMDANGLRFPAGGLVIPSNAIVTGMLVGTLATIGSAFFPALIASRIAPIEALRESAFEKNRSWKWRIIFVVVLISLSMLLIWNAYAADDRIKPMAYAMGAVFITIIVSIPLLVRPFTAIVGSKVAGIFLIFFGGRHAFGVTGEIAKRNNYRNPRRSGRTALALMIGVSLVVFITVFASSISATFTKYLKDNFTADLIIGGLSGAAQLSPERCAAISQDEVVKSSSCMTQAEISIDLDYTGSEDRQFTRAEFLLAISSESYSDLFSTKYKGSMELGNNGLAVGKKYAEDEKLKLGSEIKLGGGNQDKVFVVKAIVDEPILGSNITLDEEGFNEVTGERNSFLAMAALNDGVSSKAGQESLEKLFKDTGIEITDQKALRDQQLGQINAILQIFYGLLALAIIIASIGIVNTMSLSILERRRELGLMRAVGTSKSQVRGFVRFESVIIAVMGTIIGVVTGILCSFLFIQSLKEEGFDSYAIDLTSIITIVFLSAIIGVIAGAWPAWRATKVDVLKAVTVE